MPPQKTSIDRVYTITGLSGKQDSTLPWDQESTGSTHRQNNNCHIHPQREVVQKKEDNKCWKWYHQTTEESTLLPKLDDDPLQREVPSNHCHQEGGYDVGVMLVQTKGVLDVEDSIALQELCNAQMNDVY